MPTIPLDEPSPPITPPNAKFIVYLFVVPGLIVAAIITFYLLISSIMFSRTTDPMQLIHGLESFGVTRFQSAKELADILRDERKVSVRKRSEAAKALSGVLRRSVEKGGLSKNAITMRYFICRALGEFRVDDALPDMLLAATTNRDAEETDVQEAAIGAIALLASRMLEENTDWANEQADLQNTLEELSNNREDRVRSSTAFCLGVLGTPASIDVLKKLVDDPYRDARYNAAVALARQGDEAAVDTLAEMLDVDETKGIELEENKAAKPFKRSLIIVNALRATRELAEKNANANLGEIVSEIERIVGADAELREKALLQSGAVSEAKTTLDYLKKLKRE